MPFPVIVGVGRSGTTLLRLMLDSHPELAVPPETGFLVPAAQLAASGRATPGALLELIAGAETWPDFHLSREALADALHELSPFDAASGVRAFYRLYAQRFHKPRWGDKTPMYCRHLEAIERLLPEASFIHLIRDGRDVALSVRYLWFSPGKTVGAIAADWRNRILAAREAGSRCRSYLEVRYEELVREPRAVLRRIGDAIRLDFDPAMERYHVRAPERLGEHETRRAKDGRVIITREDRLRNQRRACEPLDPGRIGRWREAMSPAERQEFAAAAGALLAELGYET